jgi:hypothetical protein
MTGSCPSSSDRIACFSAYVKFYFVNCIEFSIKSLLIDEHGCLLSRLDINTIFKVRAWERFQFMIDFEAKQV